MLKPYLLIYQTTATIPGLAIERHFTEDEAEASRAANADSIGWHAVALLTDEGVTIIGSGMTETGTGSAMKAKRKAKGEA